MRAVSSFLLAIATVATGGCDHFDFGRVFGEPRPSESATAPTPASSANDPAARADRRARELVVIAGGAIRFEGSPARRVEAGAYALLDGIGPVVNEASLRFVDLSTRLFVPERGRPPPFVAPLTATAVLARAHIDAAALGGHVPPYAAREVLARSTIEALRQSGVAVAGVRRATEGPVTALELERDGWSVALIAVTESLAEPGPAGAAKRGDTPSMLAPASISELIRAVQRARTGHDVVLVTHHGNAEDATLATKRQVAVSHAALEAGADAVIGYGPRQPLGIGWVDGRPAFYGLGSLLGQETPGEPWTSRGLLARLTFVGDDQPRIDVCPYLLDAGQPKLLDGTSRSTQEGIFRRQLERLMQQAGGGRVALPGAHSCMRIEAPK